MILKYYKKVLLLSFCVFLNPISVFAVSPERSNVKRQVLSLGGEKADPIVQKADSTGHQQYSDLNYPRRVRLGIPKVTVTKNEVQGVIGSNVTLECFIESLPKATIYWTRNDFERIQPKQHDGKYLVEEDEFRHVEHGERFRLHILNVDSNDLGTKYRCLASNDFGTESGVIYIPVPSYLQTKAFPDKAFLEVRLGSEVELGCEVKGYPLARTYWIRKSTGDQVVESDNYKVTEIEINAFHYITRLQIHRVAPHDLDKFSCVSKNSFKESEHQFRILSSSSGSYSAGWSSSEGPRALGLNSLQHFEIIASVAFIVFKLVYFWK